MIGDSGIGDILREPGGEETLRRIHEMHMRDIEKLSKLSYRALRELPEEWKKLISTHEWEQLLRDAYYRENARTRIR
jgi:hypothetical protein